MSFTKIQDVVVPTKGIAKYFFIQLLNLEIPGTTASFYWDIRSEFSAPINEGDEQVEKTPGETLLAGNLYMGSLVYDKWGTDDQYVIDWALNELGFTKL
jgi:hypothetical protein